MLTFRLYDVPHATVIINAPFRAVDNLLRALDSNWFICKNMKNVTGQVDTINLTETRYTKSGKKRKGTGIHLRIRFKIENFVRNISP